VLANLFQRLALCLHAHHVTRDVQAQQSRCGVAGEGDRSIGMTGLNVTIPVVPMANALAPTEAGDMAEYIRVSHRVAVGILNQ
jgi:hypothetical protein